MVFEMFWIKFGSVFMEFEVFTKFRVSIGEIGSLGFDCVLKFFDVGFVFKSWIWCLPLEF